MDKNDLAIWMADRWMRKKIFYFGPKMVEFLDNSKFYPILPKFLDFIKKYSLACK